MFNSMIGKYIPLDSQIHKMNSISKVICLLLFLMSLFFNDPFLIATLVILTSIMVTLSKVPVNLYLRSIAGLKMLIIFLVVITFIFHESWYLMITSTIKIILGVVYTMILTYTTSKSEITYGLEKVFAPLSRFKVPVKEMALAITLALRFIPTIFEQTEKIMKSQASRGIDFNHTNIKGKVIAISSMMVPMFILTTKKADAVADTMEVRLYSQNMKRTNYRFNKWSTFDDQMVFLHVAILIFFIVRMMIL